jgi:hypothetical protein
MSNNVLIPTTIGSLTTPIETIDQGGGVSRQVVVIGSIGDASGETQLSAGQKTSVNSIPIVVASDQSALSVQPTPTSSSSAAITPGASSTLEAGHVLKASAGNLYSLYVATTTASGWLMTFNATSAPADGAVTPVEAVQIPAGSAAAISFDGAPPDFYSTGIVAVFSSTGPFTKTASSTAFFKWRVQ